MRLFPLIASFFALPTKVRQPVVTKWCNFRGVRTILKLGGPGINIQEGALILQKIGWAQLYVLPYFHQILGGPGPTQPIN